MIIKPLAPLILMLLALSAHAADKSFGPYTIHYNAFSSDFLTAPIAKSHGIARSKYRAILNVTVIRETDGKQLPIEADITATAFNMLQQAKPIKMRKIEEKDAIYYLAEFSVANEEIINFKIDVRDGNTLIGGVSFQQQFFH